MGRFHCVALIAGIYVAAATAAGCAHKAVEPLRWHVMRSGTTADLFSVWGSSPSDVFAAGTAGTMLHYDGSTWSAMTSGTGADLARVWGLSVADVFAVGGFESGNGVILHYDGTSWACSANSPDYEFLGIWAASATDVFAVGSNQYNAGTILHYDGSSWSTMAGGNAIAGKAVWGSSASDVFAIGASSSDPYQGAVLRFDGSSWSQMEMIALNENLFYDVWGSSGSDVYIAAPYVCDLGPPPCGGSLVHFNGQAWSDAADFGRAVVSIWGTSAGDIFAVGDEMMHFDGVSWNSISAGDRGGAEAVWAGSPSDDFAVGRKGLILHYGARQ
jgi:hypothetical protein